MALRCAAVLAGLWAGVLLLLNDTVTRFTEYYGLVLGVVILIFALGLRKGLLGFVVDYWASRRKFSAGQAVTQADRGGGH